MVSACDTERSEQNGVVEQKDTEATLCGRGLGTGTLRIAPDRLTWTEHSKQVGFSLLYPNISLHAIKREPQPSLYMMIDHRPELPEGLDDKKDEDEGEENDDEEGPLTELTFVPADGDAVQRLFDAMSECQAMHPDPNDSFSEEEEEEDDEIYQDASDIMDENGSGNHVNPVEENMEGLQVEPSNNHSTEDGDDMDCDPEQFADANS